jgi:hypothetical protein
MSCCTKDAIIKQNMCSLLKIVEFILQIACRASKEPERWVTFVSSG